MKTYILVEKDKDHNYYIRRFWIYSSEEIARERQLFLEKNKLPCYSYELYSSSVDSGENQFVPDYSMSA